MTDQLIQTFLDNFNYINSDGERNGWQIFRNKELIHALEKTARSLRNKLTDLIANTELTDAKKAEIFHDTIRGHFYLAEVDRAQFGTPVDNAKPSETQASTGVTYQTIWKKPYPPANFEAALIKALDAVNKQIAAKIIPTKDINTMQEYCSSLINEIKNFKPQEKVAVRINL